ncbi:M14 family zinc carboxypeptidase [Nostoc sp. 'Lobaria pulmonaria (5183) cyanobiont']|uniref:M14 family zinc carboxypeptidase n=1 Tax=Nostoc sp. 'Lobaria pulmonaria (5183) cyanobiont' TaxID=1618022 RepID=UPI000CF30E65|nr:M14 family zinc carboxypeptidase [Nostoc sp. 'Lobaria pulmonaria (5183) cyanobiont']
MPDVRFDKYYRYEDLTRIVHSYAKEFPQLVRIESIGKSYEGRDIWLLTVTNFATGAHQEKPAVWVDGNIHATELAPSSVCLYLLQTLVTAYGTHSEITRCLDTRTFYICPVSILMVLSWHWLTNRNLFAPVLVLIPTMTKATMG